jgi:hypothetical protein
VFVPSGKPVVFGGAEDGTAGPEDGTAGAEDGTAGAEDGTAGKAGFRLLPAAHPTPASRSATMRIARKTMFSLDSLANMVFPLHHPGQPSAGIGMRSRGRPVRQWVTGTAPPCSQQATRPDGMAVKEVQHHECRHDSQQEKPGEGPDP